MTTQKEARLNEKMKLREFTWWPKTWLTEASRISPADQVRRGHLEECELSPQGLLIIVNDYYGERVFGNVPHPSDNSPGNMGILLDFLLKHIGDTIETIEDLDVEPDQFN